MVDIYFFIMFNVYIGCEVYQNPTFNVTVNDLARGVCESSTATPHPATETSGSVPLYFVQQ